MKPATTLLALGLLPYLLVGPVAVASTDPAARCKDKKAKAVGKKTVALLAAFGRNFRDSNPSKLATGVSKAQSKLTKDFAKEENRGGCETMGDVVAIEAKVDALVADVIAVALSSGRVGEGFQVNTYTTGNQELPAVGMDADGNFVVVWESDSGPAGQDGDGAGVFAQRYAGDGAAVGSEFQVNTHTTSDQGDPSVAVEPDGDFVVVWRSSGQDGSDWGVFGQRYDSGGAVVGSEFQVNTYTTGGQFRSAVAVDPDGNFAVVWTSDDQDGDDRGVFAQRFDATGAAVGSEFQVNTYTTARQSEAAVALDTGGDFVVVWSSVGQDGSGYGVFGQRFDGTGAPAGSEFQVNTTTTGSQRTPAVAVDGDGNMVVSWNAGGVVGRLYDSSGAATGPEFTVDPSFAQINPAVAIDLDGDFVVVWGSGGAVLGRRFDSVGMPVGFPFQADSAKGAAGSPAVAMDADGNFVVVWVTSSLDGSGSGVFGQRYGN